MENNNLPTSPNKARNITLVAIVAAIYAAITFVILCH